MKLYFFLLSLNMLLVMILLIFELFLCSDFFYDDHNSNRIISCSIPSSSNFLTTKSSRVVRKPSYLQDCHCALTSAFCVTTHPLSQVLDYTKLSSIYRHAILSTSSKLRPRCYAKVIGIPEWEQALEYDIKVLQVNDIWSIVDLPTDKRVVECKLIYKVKHEADGSIERFKAHLMAKGFTQQKGVDYIDTFAPMVKLVIVKLLLALATYKN